MVVLITYNHNVQWKYAPIFLCGYIPESSDTIVKDVLLLVDTLLLWWFSLPIITMCDDNYYIVIQRPRVLCLI